MKTLAYALPLAVLILNACVKEDPVDVLTPGCGSDGARVEATIGNSDWCANTSVMAHGSDGSAIITGVSLTGGTLIMEVDSIGIGQQPITEGSNAVLYTALEGSFTVPSMAHGTLDITNYDPTSGRLSGTVDVGLRLNGEGPSKQVAASFDVTITGQ